MTMAFLAIRLQERKRDEDLFHQDCSVRGKRIAGKLKHYFPISSNGFRELTQSPLLPIGIHSGIRSISACGYLIDLGAIKEDGSEDKITMANLFASRGYGLGLIERYNASLADLNKAIVDDLN